MRGTLISTDIGQIDKIGIFFFIETELYFTAFTEVKNCPISGENSVANYILKEHVISEAACKISCLKNENCMYYIYASGTCYCGDLNEENPWEPPTSFTTENVDVHLKDASQATDDPFASCGRETQGFAIAPSVPVKSEGTSYQ